MWVGAGRGGGTPGLRTRLRLGTPWAFGLKGPSGTFGYKERTSHLSLGEGWRVPRASPQRPPPLGALPPGAGQGR